MVKYRDIVFCFSGLFSVFALGEYKPLEIALLNSECGVIWMDSPWPFHITKTVSPTLSLIPLPPAPPPPAIPVEVTVAAKTAGAVASTASIAAVSPMVVTQANRIGTVTNVLSCDDNSGFDSSPLDWTLSPLQISLGEGFLQYVDGAVLGNWVLFGGLGIAYTALAKKFGDTAVRYPGYLVLPGLFLSSPTAQNAVTMIRLGNSVEKAFGSVSLAAQLGIVGLTTRILWPSRFQAMVQKEPGASILYYLGKLGVIGQFLASHLAGIGEKGAKQKWRPKQEEQKHFVKQYGPLFRDYGQNWYGFMVPELLMTIASGTLDSFQINPQSSCDALLYTSTGVYGTYAMAVIALRPHRLKFDRIYFGSVAGMQFAALIIGIAQKNAPALENSTTLQAVAEGIPIALQYLTLARSVYDLGMQVASGCKYYQDQKRKNAADPQVGTSKLAIDLDNPEAVVLAPNEHIVEPVMTRDDDSDTLSTVSLGSGQPDEPGVMLNEQNENSLPQDGVIRTRAFTFNSPESVEQMRSRLADLFAQEDEKPAPKIIDESLL